MIENLISTGADSLFGDIWYISTSEPAFVSIRLPENLIMESGGDADSQEPIHGLLYVCISIPHVRGAVHHR